VGEVRVATVEQGGPFSRRCGAAKPSEKPRSARTTSVGVRQRAGADSQLRVTVDCAAIRRVDALAPDWLMTEDEAASPQPPKQGRCDDVRVE